MKSPVSCLQPSTRSLISVLTALMSLGIPKSQGVLGPHPAYSTVGIL